LIPSYALKPTQPKRQKRRQTKNIALKKTKIHRTDSRAFCTDKKRKKKKKKKKEGQKHQGH
jgi:hypothetical protein